MEIVFQLASVQGRDGAPEVIGKAIAKVPILTLIVADGGYSGPMLASVLKE